MSTGGIDINITSNIVAFQIWKENDLLDKDQLLLATPLATGDQVTRLQLCLLEALDTGVREAVMNWNVMALEEMSDG